MAQVSKYPISKSVADRVFNIFIKAIIEVKNKQDAQNLINDLFSPTEKIMLAKRLAIAFLLMKGYEYREICKILRVSVSTIAAVSLSLRHGSDGYATLLERITKEERLEDFFAETAEKLLSIPAKSTAGGGVWRHLRDEVKVSRLKKSKQPF